MEAPASTPAAPTIEKAVQLNEDAQLRVLSGRTTYVAEAKKKKEEEDKKDKKVDEATKTDKPWTDMSGKKQPGTAVKGEKYTGKDAEKEEKSDKKAKKESVEPEFKSKFMKMVEAKKDEAEKKKADKKKKMDEGSKPDFADIDDDGDEKETMKDAAADKKAGNKGGDKKDGKKGMSAAQEKFFGKKEVKEATKTDKPWTDMSGKKQPGTAVKGDKYTGKDAEKEAKAKSKKDESRQRFDSMVAESAVSFKEMIKLVQESGGQQAIDPLDQQLFAWAQRVAKSKFNEGMKAEVYAGMVYERMGGRFEMYDVLSEDQK